MHNMRIHQCMHPRILAWVRRRGMDLRNLVHICLVVGFVMMIHEKQKNMDENIYVSFA